MKRFLIGHKLWHIITSGISKSVKLDFEDDNKFIEWLEDWDNRNHQIITWLGNTTIPTIHVQFDAFNNANKLWDFLSTRFQSIGLAHYCQLHSTLASLNQDTRQSINEYLATLQSIWTKLDQIKISSDHLCLIKVLMGLRPEYESVCATLLHCSLLPSLDTMIQEILFEEKWLDIIPSKQSKVVFASTHPHNTYEAFLSKNCKLSGHKFVDCPKIV